MLRILRSSERRSLRGVCSFRNANVCIIIINRAIDVIVSQSPLRLRIPLVSLIGLMDRKPKARSVHPVRGARERLISRKLHKVVAAYRDSCPEVWCTNLIVIL